MQVSGSHRVLIVLAFLSSTPALRAQAIRLADLRAGDGFSGDFYGRSADVFGERALAGAPRDDDLGFHSGSAYLFERQPNGEWMQAAKLLASNGSNGNEFGYAVSIFGDRAMVAALRDEEIVPGGGTVYVFERQVDGSWLEVALLNPSDAPDVRWFGSALTLRQDRALIAAMSPMAEDAAYLFERGSDGTWNQSAKLVPSDYYSTMDVGYSLALSGDRAIVCATHATSSGPSLGAAYVFERDSGGNWVEVAKLMASDGYEWQGFGGSVGIDGDYVVVGAAYDDALATQAGAAYVFERDGNGVWTEVQKLTASDGAAADRFGQGVSVSLDRVAVGSPGPNSVYYFEREADGVWIETGKSLQNLGLASIEGNRAVVIAAGVVRIYAFDGGFQNYCMSAQNSVGSGALIRGSGTSSLAANDFALVAIANPWNQFGTFFMGASQVQLPFGNGFRCVNGSLSRFHPPQKTSGIGVAFHPIDNQLPPALGKFVPGATWYFQWWYRDPGDGGALFNLSDGLGVTFTL